MASWFTARSVLCLAGVLLFTAAVQPARAATTEPAAPPESENAPSAEPAGEQAARRPAILDPTQGHPLILQHRDQFPFLMRLGTGIEGNVTLALRYRRVPSQTFDLSPVGDMAIFQQRYASMTLRIPDDLPAGLYDLLVKSQGQSLIARCSIKVVDSFKSKFRFVHLSDMTVGDPSAPAFDDRLVEEVNLLAPEFIVATGDYTAWGRILDDETSWRHVLDNFARFDAPAYMACGDQDHEASYSKYVAQSPLGTFDYGGYHGILLWDHNHHPIDDLQIDFLRRDLEAPRNAVFTLIATHNDDLSFLDQLATRDLLADYLRLRKVKMVIAGGSDDWDHTEYVDRLQGLDLHYVRTHQASTCLRGRATGVSHYRVIEVDGDRVSYVYPEEDAPSGVDHSVPVGRLRVFRESSATGRVAVSIQNALNAPFTDACVWVQVAKLESARPQVAGGRLIQALDAGQSWVCQVAVDLPDKGGVKVLVTTDGSIPPPVPIKVAYEGDRELTFSGQHTKTGLHYHQSDQPVRISLTNTGDQPLQTYPVLRLNGGVLPIKVEGGDAWPIEIPASGQVTLSVRLLLARVSPGPHLMQIMFLEDPVRRVTVFPVTLARKQPYR